MIYVFSALYAEAQPLIRHFQLKKKSVVHGVDSFQDETGKMILSLTGSGVYRAIFAVSSVLAVCPPKAEDQLLFWGSAAGSGENVYRIREIHDLSSGKSYYPDVFRDTGLPDAAAVTGMHILRKGEILPDIVRADVPVLYDMESSGVYEAASHHMGPHQVTILRFVSDDGVADGKKIAPSALNSRAAEAAPAAVKVLEEMMREQGGSETPEKAVAEEPGTFPDQKMQEQLAQFLHCSASMESELKQYLTYAGLAGIDWKNSAARIMDDSCTDRRAGKALLRRLEREILEAEPSSGEDTDTTMGEEAEHVSRKDVWTASHNTSAAQGAEVKSPFSYIYIEKGAADHPRTQQILAKFPRAERIYIDNYREIFDRHRQSYRLQRRSRALILARNDGELVHHGSPVCQSFDNRYFYYCSSVMNCPYDCEYCWLKGMYESGHIVIFVNLEDTFAEVEWMLKRHPVYLCVSYDTDLASLENLTGYAKLWSEFAAEHENLSIEIRTKGTARFPEMVCTERTILAFTLSPEDACRRYERSAPDLTTRIRMVQEAMTRGFPVRLCFDPVIVYPGWKKSMLSLMETLDGSIDWKRVKDVSVGTFRISSDYIRRMRTRFPDSALLQYPYVCSEGYYHLPDDIGRDAEQYVVQLVEKRIGKDRIFLWHE
ncbi:MAG: hypothetical protein SOI56_00955 [Eubacteriales bacterium]|jgi:spore photoproduct lyase